LIVSSTGARTFAAEAARLTGMEVFVRAPGQAAAASPSLGSEQIDVGGALPRSEDADLPSGSYRARVIALPDGARQLRLALLGPSGAGSLSGSQTLIGVLLAAFVLLALGLIVPLLRDLQRLHDRTAAQAITDELTGISNRRHFSETLSMEVERAKRFDRPLAVLMLDLDDFKQVNDSYGHLQGDKVLREVAQALVAEARKVDEPARFGGEEFALALPETDIVGAAELGERIRSRIAGKAISLDRGGEKVKLTVSIGVAGTPDHPRDPHALVEIADQALYRAKREGKNRVVRGDGAAAAERARM
jgi:diguanylate cyclase (GGDEF)-like protein